MYCVKLLSILIRGPECCPNQKSLKIKEKRLMACFKRDTGGLYGFPFESLESLKSFAI